MSPAIHQTVKERAEDLRSRITPINGGPDDIAEALRHERKLCADLVRLMGDGVELMADGADREVATCVRRIMHRAARAIEETGQ